MTTSELPPVIADALDKPLVGPVALVLAAAVFILFAAVLVDRWVNRGLERHRTEAFTDPRYAPDYEGTAYHWHRPPVTGWTDDDSAHIEAVANKETDR